jgi:hypothetical protein
MTAVMRMLRLELRHNAMALMVPVVAVLFWFTTYRRVMAMPPLWNLRAAGLQMYAVIDFVTPLTGAAAWMGSRESRRRVADAVLITPRARWARLLTTWAATTIWALVAYLGCVAVVYGMTAGQVSGGGPLWWPAAVAAASLPAFTALGFAAGVLAPTRFTAPIAAIAAFFVLALSTELIGHSSHSYWQVTPIVAIAWNVGPNGGVATFYPYLPDLSIAQVMFIAGVAVTLLGTLALVGGSRAVRAAAGGVTAAGLAAAAAAVLLAGTATMDAHGMIRIPALHDAANDQPVRFTPVCSHTAIPVCLNPAYASYLASTTAALEPVLNEIAGLPGAPARILQEAATYRVDPSEGEAVMPGEGNTNGEAVYHLLLPVQMLGPTRTTAQMASQVKWTDGPNIVANFIGAGPGASQAQNAVAAALTMILGRVSADPNLQASLNEQAPGGPSLSELGGLIRGTPAQPAAQRFAALPAQTRRAWLASHLAALRDGQITLAQLP